MAWRLPGARPSWLRLWKSVWRKSLFGHPSCFARTRASTGAWTHVRSLAISLGAAGTTGQSRKRGLVFQLWKFQGVSKQCCFRTEKNWLVVEQPPEQMSPCGLTLQSRVQVLNESCLNHQLEGIRHKTGNS